MARSGSFQFRQAVMKELQQTPTFRALFRDMADEVADQAAREAPVDTDDYRKSIDVEVLDRKRGIVARVISKDPKAAWIEWGTGDPGPTPVFAPLRTALRSVMGRVAGTQVKVGRYRPGRKKRA